MSGLRRRIMIRRQPADRDRLAIMWKEFAHARTPQADHDPPGAGDHDRQRTCAIQTRGNGVFPHVQRALHPLAIATHKNSNDLSALTLASHQLTRTLPTQQLTPTLPSQQVTRPVASHQLTRPLPVGAAPRKIAVVNPGA